jgi:hypothetical protein
LSLEHRVFVLKTSNETPTRPGGGIKQPKISNSKLIWKENALETKLTQNNNILNIVRNPQLVNKINLATKPATTVASSSTLNNARFDTSVLSGGARVMTRAGGIANERIASGTPISSVKVLELNKVPTINRQVYKAMNVAVSFQQKVLLNRAVGRIDNSNTKDVNSNNFQIDFSYALVTLDRPWLSAEIIDSANLWYALMRKTGYYSSGDISEDNKGAFRAIPKAMIVIKDLSIKAQWTEEDKKAATSSIGLGCFNLANSTFKNSNELSAPGIMILGWVCEVLPKLPANDDTNFN